ncbi:hypothetical protein SCALM49S_07312 [Streptomyces californicus]
MLDTNGWPWGSPARVNASHFCSVSSQPIPTRVVLLAGPSGSGKSVLAARTGLPVLRLDDFYKEAGDPTLPRVPGSTDIDWDSAASWDADAAVAAAPAVRCAGPWRRVTTALELVLCSAFISRPLFGGVRSFLADLELAGAVSRRCPPTVTGLSQGMSWPCPRDRSGPRVELKRPHGPEWRSCLSCC